ncbi:F-box only protein [Trifolium repens]|nr:F-box only protein [Trifolium repens]
MWSNLPFDVLSSIFSFLTPDSLARARSTCKNWHTCKIFITQHKSHEAPWFLALPISNYQKSCCYAHNPITKKWHEISLDFIPFQTTLKPISPIGSLILLKVTYSTTLQLVLSNPFTRQFKYLPKLNVSRTNPACGIVTILEQNDVWNFPNFRIYVAGGMSEANHGGAAYERTVEMYDSCVDTWKIYGSMPVEFSVRLTVWTPNENVCVKGTRTTTTLYWITSARAYSAMGFDVGNNCWRQFGVPLADKLEFATLVRWNGGLGLVGGTCGGSVCVWEMSEGDKWCLVDEMPIELGLRLLCGKRNWEGVKCVSDDDAICLYRELGYGMVVCRKVAEMGRWEWDWVDECGYIKGKKVLNCPIRGILVHPTLALSSIF